MVSHICRILGSREGIAKAKSEITIGLKIMVRLYMMAMNHY